MIRYEYIGYEQPSNYLMHHGVRGQKWGVRNAETEQKYNPTGRRGSGGNNNHSGLKKGLGVAAGVLGAAAIGAGIYGAAKSGAFRGIGKSGPLRLGSGPVSNLPSIPGSVRPSSGFSNIKSGLKRVGSYYKRFGTDAAKFAKTGASKVKDATSRARAKLSYKYGVGAPGVDPIYNPPKNKGWPKGYRPKNTTPIYTTATYTTNARFR